MRKWLMVHLQIQIEMHSRVIYVMIIKLTLREYTQAAPLQMLKNVGEIREALEAPGLDGDGGGVVWG